MDKNNTTPSFTLRYLRKRAGLTQGQMAILLSERFEKIGSLREGIHRNSISSWEKGKHFPRLTPKEMLELCDLLECTLLELAQATDYLEKI